MNLRDLDTKSYDGKVWLFSGPKPLEGRRRRSSVGETHEERIAKGDYESFTIPMRNQGDFGWYDVKTDKKGNITSMPLLVGRPCFGIITARLRHGTLTDTTIRRGKFVRMVPSRCGRCNVHDACHRLVDERIKASSDIEEAVKVWSKKGGRNIFETQEAFHANRGCWTTLVQTVRNKVFTSVNDQAVAASWIAEEKARLEKDRIRKAEERRKARRRGVVDFDLAKQAMVERNDRIVRLEHARKHASPPHWITKLNDQSSTNIADAWMTHYLLRSAKNITNPSSIATKMMKRCRYRHLAHGSLRARLKNDLARAIQLEIIVLDGETSPIWKPFLPI